MKKVVLKFGRALLFVFVKVVLEPLAVLVKGHVGAVLTFAACGGSQQSAGEATEQHADDHSHDHGAAGHDHADHDHGTATSAMEGHGEGKEYTSAYICPMHCEGSGSEEPGKCPVCGMAYVAKTEHDANPHSH